jgi:hypothetical protein
MPGGARGSRWLARWWRSSGEVPSSPEGLGPACEPVDPHGRAIAAFEALDAAFGVRRTPSLFKEAAGRTRPRYAHLWPFSRAAAAVLDLVELDALPAERALGVLGDGLACYRRSDGVPPAYDSAVRPPLGPGGDRFYDDNAWVGLDLVRLHQLTGEPQALERAVAVFAFLVSGWDDDPGRAHPGGVAWVESAHNTDRNTVSTAPAAQLGYQLASLGAVGPEERAWVDRMLAWVHDVLRDPADGLYWDHIDATGAIERTKWSYNQGNVIGAELARHLLDGEGGTDAAGDGSAEGDPRASLARAEAVAEAALDHYEAAPGGLAAQGLAFDAVFFRNLLDLRRVSGGPLGERIRRAVVDFAEEAWSARCDTTGSVRPGRRGGEVALLDQAAMVEIQALAAMAVEPPPRPVGAGPPSSPAAGNG